MSVVDEVPSRRSRKRIKAIGTRGGVRRCNVRAVLHGCLGAALSLLFLAGAAEGQATPTVHIEIEVRAPVDDNGRLMPEVEKAEFPIIVRLKFPPLPGVCTS